ncbi:hypothetical protein SCHPADRAFT_826811 [Schizopora paradoxa]|uniref:N-acetyltransferase ECO1 n=1 Tax=Schizopora paradoxa TaxID=27342 RepID=A0A0H2RXG6_9AGAM|nr:hypothetical protein SCHPADRAFT_826811 [Schizopora paradoxa]
MKRKRPFTEILSNVAPLKKRTTSSKHSLKDSKNVKPLTQLHFSIDRSIVRSCSLCGLSYTQGAIGDESLHKTHCARIRKGMEWGKEEERERLKYGSSAVEVDDDVYLKGRESGRIISVDAACGGKIGHRVSTFLQTVNEALSAPSMESDALKSSRVYLFLLKTSETTTATREKIVGCIVAQRIEHAMEIASSSEPSGQDPSSSLSLVHVEGNLFCNPRPLPTPMGIARLFVSSAHRRKGIAQALLNAAARTFVHGCTLNPARGEVAFSQPTSLGKSVMENWGKGGVRIYEEHVRKKKSDS